MLARMAYEVAVGFRQRPGHLFETRYGPRDDVFGFQWVADAPILSWTR